MTASWSRRPIRFGGGLVLSLWLLAGCSGADVDSTDAQDSDRVETLSSDLAMLFVHEPGTPFDGAGFEGSLIVDFPCVYGESQSGGELIRVAIALPDFSEYDAATNSVRVGDGPWLTTGDQVRGGGGYATQQAASLCPAGETLSSIFLEDASS